MFKMDENRQTCVMQTRRVQLRTLVLLPPLSHASDRAASYAPRLLKIEIAKHQLVGQEWKGCQLNQHNKWK
jgi:hypothetical protein